MRLWALPWVVVLLVFAGAPARAQSNPPPHYCMDCNFAGMALADRDFSGDVVVGSNFAGAKLSGASFRDAKIVAANFQAADLTHVTFDGAECTACNFKGAKLDGSTFSGARMVAANFAGFASAVTDAALRDLLGGCAACNFQAASLTGRDLSGTLMLDVDLTGADLRNTRLDGAVLCWYVANGSERTTKCDGLKDARVEGASFRGVRLCRDPADAATCTVVSGADLQRNSGSSLSGAALP